MNQPYGHRANIYLNDYDYALWLKLPPNQRSRWVAKKLQEEFKKKT